MDVIAYVQPKFKVYERFTVSRRYPWCMMTSSNGNNFFRVTATQRPVTRSYDVFFDLRLNKPLSKHWWGWWLRHYRAHYGVTVMCMSMFWWFRNSKHQAFVLERASELVRLGILRRVSCISVCSFLSFVVGISRNVTALSRLKNINCTFKIVYTSC